MAPRIRPEGLTLGLMLVGLGAVALLHNFGRLDFLSTVRTFWPLSLLVWGALEIAASLKDRALKRH